MESINYFKFVNSKINKNSGMKISIINSINYKNTTTNIEFRFCKYKVVDPILIKII